MRVVSTTCSKSANIKFIKYDFHRPSATCCSLNQLASSLRHYGWVSVAYSSGTYWDPTGAGSGGDEKEAATRFNASTHPIISALSLEENNGIFEIAVQ